MYNNNSDFSAKSEVTESKKKSVLYRKVVHFNPLLFLY